MREDRRHWIIFDPTVISHSRSLFEREVEAMKFATRRAKQKKSKEISEKSISPMASFTELQEGTVNHTRFFIGALIEDNAWEGKLLYEGHLIDVTVQTFKRVADAASYVAMLQKLNADHIFGIPSGYMFDRLDGGDEMPGLVFLEPMKSLSSWMERRKQNMWRKHGRYCLGVGSDFQDLFGDVGKAMHILTCCGYTHGSLAEYGVMLISNNKVRLVNMDPASFEIRDISGSSAIFWYRQASMQCT